MEVEGVTRLQCEWRLRDASCGEELISRINKVLNGLGHYPNLSLEQPNIVKADFYTPTAGMFNLYIDNKSNFSFTLSFQASGLICIRLDYESKLCLVSSTYYFSINTDVISNC